MTVRRGFTIVVWLCVIAGVGYGAWVVHHGFSAAAEPTAVERIVARTVRNISIPSAARNEHNPIVITPDLLEQARQNFNDKCAVCHGGDGSARRPVGANLYPKAPELGAAGTQSLTDGEIHYIIRNGVRLTGMPAWAAMGGGADNDAWALVAFIRRLAKTAPAEQAAQTASLGAAHYVGSKACAECHVDLYRRWAKTPMANVVRDPKVDSGAIIPSLATNNVSPKFTKDQIAFVYGSLWKQRYFTKVGDDYYPEPAQWDVAAKAWKPYHVPGTADWWTAFYPDDNLQRPTGPLCDGCHSVGYDIHTKQVAEWNVGCERCHGPGSEHVSHPTRTNIIDPARMDDASADDTCIQCHSQGRPPQGAIEGRYYDWPVGYRVGLKLSDFWALEDHTLGQTTFTHYADGTAHKNRMQGNDFVQSLMYRRGVTCFSCHDVHGTGNYAQLREPVDRICLDCHGPGSGNGPREATIEAHTHHKADSAGSQCVACHMPKIEPEIPGTNVRAHTFAFITPAMTDKYKIDSPCISCHKDQTTAWAGDEMRKWAGKAWRVD